MTQSVGTSTKIQLLGFLTDSTMSAVTEGQRKFMGTIWNTYAFFVLYANIDNFDATKYTAWNMISFRLWISGFFQS